MQVGPLLLRYAVPSDVDPILEFRNDPVANRFTLRTHVDPETFRQELLAAPTSDSDFGCVAELDGAPVALGFLQVVDGMGQPGMPLRTEAILGYIVRPDVWGRGIGAGLARGLLDAAFGPLCLRRVTAACNADNPASVRILEGWACGASSTASPTPGTPSSAGWTDTPTRCSPPSGRSSAAGPGQQHPDAAATAD